MFIKWDFGGCLWRSPGRLSQTCALRAGMKCSHPAWSEQPPSVGHGGSGQPHVWRTRFKYFPIRSFKMKWLLPRSIWWRLLRQRPHSHGSTSLPLGFLRKIRTHEGQHFISSKTKSKQVILYKTLWHECSNIKPISHWKTIQFIV